MRRASIAVVLALGTSCMNFRDAEKRYCLERLDVCGLGQGAHVEDGIPFVAVLHASQAALDPYEPIPNLGMIEFSGVLDRETYQLGYTWKSTPFVIDNIEISRPDGVSRLLHQVELRRGVIGLDWEWVADLEAGFVTVTALSTTGEKIGGPAVVPGRELWMASLSGWLATPPRLDGVQARVAFQLERTSRSVRYAVRPPGSGLFTRGIAVPGEWDPAPTTLMDNVNLNDIVLTEDELRALDLGLMYALRNSMAGDFRGQFLPPGAAPYITKMTSEQNVGGSGVATPMNGMVTWFPNRPLQLVVAVGGDPGAVPNVLFETGPAGMNGAPVDFLPNFASSPASQGLRDILRQRLVSVSAPNVRGQLWRPGERFYFTSLTIAGAAEFGGAQLVVNPQSNMAYLAGRTSPVDSDVVGARLQWSGVTIPVDLARIQGTTSGGYTFDWQGTPSIQLLNELANNNVSVVVEKSNGSVLSSFLRAP